MKRLGFLFITAVLFCSVVMTVSSCKKDNLMDGSSFLIQTPAQLAELAERVNAGTEPPGLYYKLLTDIDLSGYGAGWNNGAGWIPIGHARNGIGFSGHFDGNGHTVSNLYINCTEYYYTGLFGVVRGGAVKNLGIVDADITGGRYNNGVENYVGGVAGYIGKGSISGNVGIISGIITNCYVTGVISGYQYVGGVAGSSRSSITNCYATCAVSGTGSSVGGVVGDITNGSIDNCYATGTVSSGYHDVGGVAGCMINGSMTNCYATGAVSGNDAVGGVAGNVIEGSNMTNCYATGAVKGSRNVGGVAGQVIGSNITNCAALNSSIYSVSVYTSSGRIAGDVISNSTLSNNVAWDGMTSNVTLQTSNNRAGTGITAAAAKTQNTYQSTLGWNFSSVWKWGGTAYSLPVLNWQTSVPAMPVHL